MFFTNFFRNDYNNPTLRAEAEQGLMVNYYSWNAELMVLFADV